MDRNGRALPLLDDETRAVKSARFSTQRWITKAVLLENAAPLVQRRASTCSETSFARELLEQRRSSFRLSGVRWALPTGGLSCNHLNMSPLYTSSLKSPGVPAWLVDPTTLRVLQHSSRSSRSCAASAPCTPLEYKCSETDPRPYL